MTAAERMAHWSFKLMGLSLLSAMAIGALMIVTVQLWLIVYWNPWGFALFPLRETMLTMASGIILCLAISFIGVIWNSAP